MFCCCLESDAKIWSKGKSRVSIYFVLQINLISTINTKLTQKCPFKVIVIDSFVAHLYLPISLSIWNSYFDFAFLKYLFSIILQTMILARKKINNLQKQLDMIGMLS